MPQRVSAMCSSVRYRGRNYETPREFAELVGGTNNLVWRKAEPRRLDLCLCPVDVKETLASAGYSWSQGNDPMEYFVMERSR